MKLSKSKILCFDSCEFRYDLQYNKKISVPPTPALLKGIKIHNVCEKFFKFETLEEGKNYLMLDDTVGQYLEVFENFYKFAEKLSPDGIKIRKPIFNETRFVNKELDINGVVDVVFKDDYGNIILLDWKTGKNRGLDHHLFELGMYSILLQETEAKPTHWGIFFLEDLEDAFQKEKIDILEIAKSKRKILDTRKKIQETKVFLKNPTYSCKYCGFYKVHCEGVK